MPKAWSATSRGFSLVEVLLAVTVFAVLSVGIIGALIYGRAGTAESGEYVRANLLAEEGVEAIRNIRDSNYANLTDGTFGLSRSSGIWATTGTSDTSGMFTRQTTVTANGANTKLITSNVTWNGVSGSGSTSVASQVSNWMANFTKSWVTPSQYSQLDLAGAIAGFKVWTQGNFAYVIRNSATGPNFFVINISNPNSPTVVGTLTLTGSPTNIHGNGNFAYVSANATSAELQIVNIAVPTAPSLAGTYNAAGTARGLGVYSVGSVVYLVRAANGTNDEFVIINASTPASPTRLGGYSLNISMNEVYVNGGAAYIATSSDTQEVFVINIAIPGLLTLGTSLNLPGTTDATTIDGFGNILAIGQGTTMHILGLTLSLIPTVSSSIVLPGTINDVSVDTAHGYVHAGTSFATGEFQVINAQNPFAPVILSSVDMPGTQVLNGVDYNLDLDVVPGVTSNTSSEFRVFGPN